MSGDSKTGAKSGFASPYVVLKRIPQFFLPRVGRGSRHHVMTKRATQVGLLQRKIPVHFAAQKAPETYRVFALGGSASLGWPHAFTKSYPHFLQHKLKKLLPARDPEVHNLGGMMFPTYKVRILFEEIIEYEPDLILIYAGNNEFLDDALYLENPDQGGVAAGSSARPPLQRRADSFFGMDRRSISWSFHKPNPVWTDPDQFATARDHYRHNLEAMAHACQKAGIPLLLLTVPANLEWKPNVSVHEAGITPSQLELWKKNYAAGWRELEAERFEGAIDLLQQACEAGTKYAESWFYLGRALQGAERYQEAKQALEKALFLDAYPFRCLFNEDIHEVAHRLEVPLVDSAGAIERVASNGIVGFEQLVDYVHPTVASNELIAQTVVDRLLELDMLPEPAPLSAESLSGPVRVDDEDDITTLRQLMSLLLRMHQWDELPGLVDRLYAVIDTKFSDSSFYQDLRKKLDVCVKIYTDYWQLLRSEIDHQIEFSREEAEAIYSVYVDQIWTEMDEEQFVSRDDFKEWVPSKNFQALAPCPVDSATFRRVAGSRIELFSTDGGGFQLVCQRDVVERRFAGHAEMKTPAQFVCSLNDQPFTRQDLPGHFEEQQAREFLAGLVGSGILELVRDSST